MESFGCPHCGEDVAGLPYDADEGECEHCRGHLYLSDMIGFHLDNGIPWLEALEGKPYAPAVGGAVH